MTTFYTYPEPTPKVAMPARRSTTLRLAILTAFAAPLIQLSGLQNFSINIFGRSKVGKTTALLASTSTYGIGFEQSLPNWNATPAAFMEEARAYNDLVLPGNEVGLLTGRKQDAWGPIRTRIYTYAEGRDRSRMSKAGVTTPKYSSTYRGIAVFTAEYSFEEYAQMAGEIRSPGEYARAMDVPAVHGHNTTIFDKYPQQLSPSKRQEWAQAELIKLRHACGQHRGSAIEPYIRYLISTGDELPALVQSRIKEFSAKVRELQLDPALEHAAKNFGLLFAAGCLGIEAKILPWSREITLAVVLKCFERAIRVIKSKDDLLKAAKRELEKRLASENIKDLSESAHFGPKDAVGFWKKSNGKTLLTIHSARFRDWFTNRIQAAAILRWLMDEGLLVIGDKPMQPSPTTTEWAERSPKWPNDTTQKSFIFYHPFPRAAVQRGIGTR